MRYVAAYLLAVLGGKESPAAADIEKILSSVGIEADATRLTKVVADLKGKSVDELIKEGREKLSSMPVGGGGAAPAAAGAAAPAAAKEEKKGKHQLKIDSVLITIIVMINQHYHLSHDKYVDSNFVTESFSKKKTSILYLNTEYGVNNSFFIYFVEEQKKEESEEEDDDMGFGLFE